MKSPDYAPLHTSSTHSVPIHGTNGIASTGTLRLAHLSTLARSKRAAKRLALFWLLALFSVGIPGLHFILVPGFLIAGVIIWVLTWRERTRIGGGEAVCPACKSNYPIEEQALRWPLDIVCSKCGQFAWIEAISLQSGE